MLTAINNQQQSFGAKLNIKNINMPHKEEISKEFAKITKHYKEDTLDISAELIFRDDGSAFKNTNFACNGTDIGYLPKLKNFKNFCKEHSPKEIAKSLGRVFKLGKLTEKTSKKRSDIHKNMNSVNGLLLKAQFNQGSSNNKVLNNLINNAEARLATLKSQLASTQKHHLNVTNKIRGNDQLANAIELD